MAKSKTKSMGTEYQIVAKGNWEQVADVARITKEAIESTRAEEGFFTVSPLTMESGELENRILKAYLLPQEGETFADYKNRFIQAFAGTGAKGKLASLLSGKKVQLNFHLFRNGGESTLKIESLIGEGRYQATIGASGDYSDRGASIATDVKEALEQASVQHTYRTLDRLI